MTPSFEAAMAFLMESAEQWLREAVLARPRSGAELGLYDDSDECKQDDEHEDRDLDLV